MKFGSWTPSIRTLVGMIVVSPIIAVSLTLATLSWVSSSRISANLADQVMTSACNSVAENIQNYLDDSVRLSNRYVRKVDKGEFPDPPNQSWEAPMLDDLTTTPSIASICWGNVAGDATWLLRGPNRLEVGRTNGPAGGKTVEFAVDPDTGKTIGPPLRETIYDPRQRPWWKTAVESNEPCWTAIYPWFAASSAETTVGTGYTRQVRRADGTLRGVLVVDVTLGSLSDFLSQLDIAKDGRAYLIDNQDRLIAASVGHVMDDSGKTFKLVPPRAVTTIDGIPARSHVAKIHPYPGIDWRVITVVPESAFLTEAQRLRHRAVVATVVAVFASLLLGLALSQNLSRPIVSMAEHVKCVSEGDFERRLNLGGAKELANLSDELNRMSSGLRERLTLEQSLAVAMEVQQSLLPASDPKPPGLDVAGRSKYCEGTGGDYFDFIHVATLPDSTLLLAVGDVMGHGIAAALLMATVRGALHFGALERPTLGDLMTKANDVLAADNRHHRFMTLSLTLIDGTTGDVTWASAGHDPAVVYEPAIDQFRELVGGDVPLGIEAGVDFANYHDRALMPGNVMLIGTDGVWEARNDAQDMYGKERMKEVMRTHHRSSAANIAAALQADLATFCGTVPFADDVTFVVIKAVAVN